MRPLIFDVESTGFVSIHASVKDATAVIEGFNPPSGFNPRICKRCDRQISFHLRLNRVSIHASVKDATITEINVRYINRFQSTHL